MLPPIVGYVGVWLPVITALGLAAKGILMIRAAFKKAKQDVGNWANQLLDNHMTHIQSAAEQAAASLKSMSDTNREMVVAMKEMREDFQTHQVEEMRVQNAIMTGIEVIKAKVD